MLKFVTFAVKTQSNVHDLNNEAVAGNVTDIRMMEFLNEQGEKDEAPAVSGRMLKHWHCEIMRKLSLKRNIPLCDSCKIGEPVRPAKLTADNKLSHQEAIAKGIEEVVKNCAICDVHGFLAAITGRSERRSSRAMFSWLMPVISVPPKQVIHSRVKSGMDFKEEELTSQMPFNKSYASGIYAFVSALDVDRIGLVELCLCKENPRAIDETQRKDRIKVAIESYRFMISGEIGASLSHAIPHQKPLEILAVYSENSVLPFPVSPMYSDYVNKTLGILPNDAQVLYWGPEHYNRIKKVETINEIFNELLGKIER